MTSREELKKQFQNAAGAAAGEADAILQDDLKRLLAADPADLDRLIPSVSDRAAYEQLIAVVKEATAHNLAISEVVNRVKQLGQAGLRIVKEVKTLLPLA